jgi:hypothetical protein
MTHPPAGFELVGGHKSTLVSVTTVVRFCVVPWVMVPDVVWSARVNEIDFGGQVEKKPAEEPDPATDEVMKVVPGCPAVRVT